MEDLLDFGRMDAGRRQCRLEPVDLSALVREGIEEYGASRAAAGTASSSRRILPRSSSTPIARRSVRVIRNLLENAVKYSPIRRPSGWKQSMNRVRRCCACATRASAFRRRSTRASSTSSFAAKGEARVHQGTGIGLAMVKEIVEVHRGDVRLSSDVGRGSTFMVRLPLSSAASESVV